MTGTIKSDFYEGSENTDKALQAHKVWTISHLLIAAKYEGQQNRQY